MEAKRARWLAAVAMAALLAIAGVYGGVPWLHYLAKPVTTWLIVAMVWRLPATEPRYRAGILAGLGLSTLGDVLLMLPVDAFVFGLASFLFAHLAYLFAFSQRARLFAVIWPVLVYAALAAAVLSLLWPTLPAALALPVVVYVSVLAAMAAQAAGVWWRQRDRASAFAAIGGLCFVASDAMLALDRFRAPFAMAMATVLTTYWIAQCLIALSVSRESGLPRGPQPQRDQIKQGTQAREPAQIAVITDPGIAAGRWLAKIHAHQFAEAVA